MPYPAYRLNPGDMFQVNPDMVMLATGRQKLPGGDEPKRKKKVRSSGASEEKEEAAAEEEEAEAEAEAEAGESTEREQEPDTTDVEPIETDLAPTRQQIQGLVSHARDILAENDLSVAQKKKVRAFVKQARPLLSRAGKTSASATDIAGELSRMVAELKVSSPSSSSSSSSSSSPSSSDESTAADASETQEGQQHQQQQQRPTSIDDLTKDELRALERLMRDEEENPRDPSKPYHTPWRPRDYMSPFAFIPRYLEVNPNVCAAVYLRHPVARVGSAEVPTPYSYEVNQLAFNWYLRRR